MSACSSSADGIHWSACSASAVCAVLAGARSLAAIGEWASDAPGQVLAALGIRHDPLTGTWQPPGEATMRHVLARIDPDASTVPLAPGWPASNHPHRPPGAIGINHPATPGGRGRRQDPAR